MFSGLPDNLFQRTAHFSKLNGNDLDSVWPALKQGSIKIVKRDAVVRNSSLIRFHNYKPMYPN
jgi:hypothetical protein